MRPSLLILIVTITVLAFVAHAIGLVFVAGVSYALAFALDVLLLAVVGHRRRRSFRRCGACAVYRLILMP